MDFQKKIVDSLDVVSQMSSKPVIWFTGISGAGKSALAVRLMELMQAQSNPATLLDGDEVRDFFEGDLGYTRAERIQNVRRIAFCAKKLADFGTTVVVSNIAPYYEVRDFIRRKIPNYIQIFVSASAETVQARDVKGLYQKQKEGKLQNLVGIDDTYDLPRKPDLKIETDQEGIEDSFARVRNFLKTKGVLN